MVPYVWIFIRTDGATMNTVQYNTIRKGQVQTQYGKSKEIKNMLKEKHVEKN